MVKQDWPVHFDGKPVILSSAMASKCPLKLLLPLVILKDSSMTLEVDTRENERDTGSHILQQRDTLCFTRAVCRFQEEDAAAT